MGTLLRSPDMAGATHVTYGMGQVGPNTQLHRLRELLGQSGTGRSNLKWSDVCLLVHLGVFSHHRLSGTWDVRCEDLCSDCKSWLVLIKL